MTDLTPKRLLVIGIQNYLFPGHTHLKNVLN